MSKRNNYTNYRNMANPVDEAIPAEVKEEVVETVTEDIIETVEEPVEETPETLIGVVSVNGKQLNIRKEPSTNSDRVSVVEDGTVLMIEPDKSSEDWFKIYTEAGVEGFCMKKFVTLKQ